MTVNEERRKKSINDSLEEVYEWMVKNAKKNNGYLYEGHLWFDYNSRILGERLGRHPSNIQFILRALVSNGQLIKGVVPPFTGKYRQVYRLAKEEE